MRLISCANEIKNAKKNIKQKKVAIANNLIIQYNKNKMETNRNTNNSKKEQTNIQKYPCKY